MSKYKLTVLSPVHISSGEEFELYFNLLGDDSFIYIYDEFTIVEFFIAHDILVPSNLERLKDIIKENSQKIIESNLHLRKIESHFSKFSKPLLEQVNSAREPIVSGSSIKGSLRTAILDCMTNLNDCDELKKDFRDKSFDKKRFQKRFDNDLAELFKYLKITDSLLPLETQVYKTINIKKEKAHQKAREARTEEISNYIEAIKPNQTFEIEIKDSSDEKIFKNLGIICNKFYIPFFGQDEQLYASINGYLKEKLKNKKLSNDIFLINVGRFGGAEQKSLNNLREIKGVKESDKFKTTARTFALEKEVQDKIYFENGLLPFGWILCEKIEESISIDRDKQQEKVKERFEAIDVIYQLQDKKIEEQKALALAKAKKEKEEAEAKAKEEAEKREKLASMSPVQRLVDSYDDIAVLVNDMKMGQIENFEMIQQELAEEVKKELQKNPKTWEKAKQKALKRKEYIESLLEE